MINAAKSVQYFGVFLLIEGTLLILVPDLFLSLFLLSAEDVWVRVVGVALAILGYFYFQMGSWNIRPFLKLTTHSRSFQFVAIAIFVLLGMANPMLLLPSGFEFLCGLLTLLLLRKEG
ncbi:hypothetical protein EHQ53_05020 [Leptospira langatensis]|uniref:Uncharacterized protein n=1 Tax=Leptospira langatensis TaxID=2484983 RepID=A0A5F1ZXT9_9LEPT|nr:hypothetical protein [Leptospira langatensis]TGK02836.1 hypothetical protein EHO57_05855 [Leptospira langatensis]TGL42397.1 hypothetical protein EHQ53_05020 [Leptospira langatensis]